MQIEPPAPPASSESPSSPGVPPVELKECIEELLKLTLLSSIRGKLQTSLSSEYCVNLLRDDPSDPLRADEEVSRGVPAYPLYKSLASSLYQSIHSRALFTSYKELIPVHEDLLSMLKEVDFELHVQEPFFSQLNDGLKTIEGRCVIIGRCAIDDYKRIQAGHLLLFNKCLTLQVQDVRQYSSFHEMLEAESMARVLPGVTSNEEGVQIYRNFYSEEKERSNGVVAICVTIPTSQLHTIMASILQALSYGGIQRLLGFVETVGTNPDLLPPPAATLLSTFSAPHNPDVRP